MAAETGNTYISQTMTNGESQVYDNDEFKKVSAGDCVNGLQPEIVI